ncbi:MAG: endopeptidase La [Chitinophagales bacterium]|nr:endopeptidase La [Chitinophagales bacterium]OJV26064.1 MAG: endopeptidase La [Bacteroidetes bacterium 37-13]HRN95133.1 endopeptidase La [Chitinophagales bacterium]HRP38373.1 endopeptidase La [Chitinophagales bacterium]
MTFDFIAQNGDEEGDFLPIIPDDNDVAKTSDIPLEMPLLPLRNTVLFPGVAIPITVGRDKSILAVKEAYKTTKLIGVVGQSDPNIEEPEFNNLFKIGTVAQILRLIKMPDGSTTAIIQGRNRFIATSLLTTEPFMKAKIELLEDIIPLNDKEFNVSLETIKDLANNIIKINPQIPTDASILLKNIGNPVTLVHFISSNLNIEIKKKQDLLEMADMRDRVKLVLKYLQDELQVLEMKNEIQNKVRTEFDKQQRDYFLNQQLKTIQEELGMNSTDKDIQRLREKLEKLNPPTQVRETVEKELDKLQRMNPAAAEFSVVMNYIDTVLDLPWGSYTQDQFNIKKSKRVLDTDHYGIEKVKERILEYLAVLKLKGDMKSPILCLVGPPGVGKTSLGQSIAKALGRKYVRVALGGLHDEAEIRGHRKTYIGAMPGRIIQSLKKAKSSNPVMILDEIDKIGNDYRGDPSSALLEVLDPEQNSSFYDNYLELEYDLSKVLFIATANSLSTIQPALRDRMEIIPIEGYSIEEKVQIAKKHLVQKQIENHGLKKKQVSLSDTVLESLIEQYTKESGVRELDRVLAAVMRNTAKKVAEGTKYNAAIKTENLHEILGPEKFDKSIYAEEQQPGVSVGLAYTSVGGDILFIETTLSKGSGNLTLTGNLGDVMKESATLAVTYLKANAEKLGINAEVFKHVNIHIHVPEGAVPKDGPSAGITLFTALASLFTQRRVKPFLAMTGEITLRGKVMPVGGIKEKILAAKRAGIKEIVIGEKNRKDVAEINAAFIKGVRFTYVNNMDEVIDAALQKAKVKGALNLEYFIPVKQ